MTQIFTHVLLCLMKTEIDFVFALHTFHVRKGKNKYKSAQPFVTDGEFISTTLKTKSSDVTK